MSIFRLITQMLPSADYIVPVEIESQVHNVYVIKRPGVDRFLTEMGKIYEIVVFTASLSKVCLCHDLASFLLLLGQIIHLKATPRLSGHGQESTV